MLFASAGHSDYQTKESTCFQVGVYSSFKNPCPLAEKKEAEIPMRS